MKKQLLKAQSEAAKAANEVTQLAAKVNSMDTRTRKTVERQAKARKAKKLNQGKIRSARKVKFIAPVSGREMTPTKQARAVYGSAGKWAELLSNPFSGAPVKCPFNFNPVPSYLSFNMTLTSTKLGSISTDAGTTGQIVIFPGHATMYTSPTGNYAGSVAGYAPDMDEVAYHEVFQNVAGTPYAVGPVQYIDGAGTTRQPIIGTYTPSNTLGNTYNNSSLGSVIPLSWDNTLPLAGSVTSAGHLRHKLVALGVKIRNVTPELSRGGSIVSVQPLTVMENQPTQLRYAAQPTFYDWGPDAATIHWIPRLRDLAYWHPTAALNATAGVTSTCISSTTYESAGVWIWLNAPAGSPQTYDLEVVAHFEVSGYAVTPLSSPTAVTPIAEGSLKGALNALSSNLPSAHGVGQLLSKAAGVVFNSSGVIPRLAVAGHAMAMGALGGALSGA